MCLLAIGSITTRCSGQNRSISSRSPSISNRTLHSGRGNPASATALSSRPSSRLLSRGDRSFSARQALRIARSCGAPRLGPRASMWSTAWTSRAFRTAACSTTRRSDSLPRLPATSTRVRETVVQGTPSWTFTSEASSREVRCHRMPWSFLPDWPAAITSMTTGARSYRPSNSAAARCDTTAPSPQAKTAASMRPRRWMEGWPTAKTPRWMTCSRPEARRFAIAVSDSPRVRSCCRETRPYCRCATAAIRRSPSAVFEMCPIRT